jgi:rhodanese-related sulfurtransferase
MTKGLLVCFLLFSMSCNTTAQTNKEVSANEFEKGLTKDVQLLDVRTAREYRNGHLKGSLQANWNDNKEFTERVSSLDKNKPVYVYCMSGPRSQAAGEWLRNNGFTNVVELKGGFSNWKVTGKPSEGTPDTKQMTIEEYTQQITGKEYVLVDFGAEWCPPCKKMEPIIHEFTAANPGIFFFKIDGGIHTDVMKQLNAEGLPTFILLKNGQEVWRHKGILSKEELEKIWLEKK